jgi:hypothetical protein
MMEAACTSETSANLYQTTRSYSPEDSRLYTRRRENLKFYTSSKFRYLPLDFVSQNHKICYISIEKDTGFHTHVSNIKL